MEDLQYPIGRFTADSDASEDKRRQWIQELIEFPDLLANRVLGLEQEDLQRTYRPGGWTVRQVVHHLADSHMNAYMRFRWALTENRPGIKTYDEAAWAELHDAKEGPVVLSLQLLAALHKRWGMLLQSLPEQDFARCMRHPEWKLISLDTTLQIYVWHGRHHLAHIGLALGS